MASTILITGANRGIGLALATAALARGDRVIATARRPGDAGSLEAMMGRRGDLRIMGLDVTDPAEAAGVAAEERRAIDVLICNAGQFTARGGLDDPAYTAEAWQDVMMTNVAGVFFTVRAFLGHLERAERPRIAVISSLMGSSARAPGGAYIYRASKAAATNLARNLASDLRERGIAVGAYHPGWVRTDMGGDAANIGVEESAAGLLARIDALSIDTTGVVEDFRGEPVAF